MNTSKSRMLSTVDTRSQCLDGLLTDSGIKRVILTALLPFLFWRSGNLEFQIIEEPFYRVIYGKYLMLV